MRTFYINCKKGETLGVVAEGVEFSDGFVVLRWKEPRETTSIHPSIEKVRDREGDTEIVFLETLQPPSNINQLDTKCSVCGCPQFSSPSGDTCENGHGGAPPM